MMRLQQSGYSLGCDILLTLSLDKEKTAEGLFKSLWVIINNFNKKFSRFSVTSELTKVNLSAGQKTKVSQEFLKLTRISRDYCEKTNGFFNPFILPSLQKAGYKGSWPKVDDFDSQLDFSKRSSSFAASDIVIEKGFITIPLNSAIDFGGIGKGFLADKLANFLLSKNVANFWLSIGGEIVCSGQDNEDKSWQVGIAGIKDDRLVDSIDNKNGQTLAVATSGVTKRKGSGWHHIIDPRTLKPSKSNVLIASVVANSCTLADIYASCLVIEGEKFIEKIRNNTSVQKIVLQLNEKSHYKIKKIQIN